MHDCQRHTCKWGYVRGDITSPPKTDQHYLQILQTTERSNTQGQERTMEIFIWCNASPNTKTKSPPPPPSLLNNNDNNDNNPPWIRDIFTRDNSLYTTEKQPQDSNWPNTKFLSTHRVSSSSDSTLWYCPSGIWQLNEVALYLNRPDNLPYWAGDVYTITYHTTAEVNERI